ncbi:MAG: O-antigen polysaccharide polymerase Wzy [Kofleriaceae bacterium]|nr:O-antigen polysaccharide polymerase Wzy [Kofleriaceae bacterium]
MSGRVVTGLAPRRATWTGLEFAVQVAVVVSLYLFRDDIVSMSLWNLALLDTLVALAVVASVIRGAPRLVWSPTSVYAVVLVIFHAGLAMAMVAGRVSPHAFPALDEWLYRPSTRTAMWVTSLGLVGFALGVRLARSTPPARFRERRIDDELNQLMAVASFIVIAGAMLLWFGHSISRGGVSILVGSYDQFLDRTDEGMLWISYYAIDVAMVFAAACTWTKWHRGTLAIFVGWSLLAFPLGLRGEILFPTVTALAVVSARRRTLPAGKTLVVAIVALSAIAAVRQVRSVGLTGLSGSDISVSPVDGLIEMGTSLRPVSEVVFWREHGDDFADGATYWAPIDRALYYVIPGWSRPPVDRDERLMSVVVMSRAGPIGFSVMAEAYRNFGPEGALLVLAFFGYLLGRIDTWPTTRLHQSAAGIVLLGLLHHIRNSFVPIPSQLAIGFALIGLILLIATLGKGQRRTSMRQQV